MASPITVAVRCRAMTPKEQREGSTTVVSMDGPTTTVTDPQGAPVTATTTHAFWSGAKDHPRYVSQGGVTKTLAPPVAESCLGGTDAAVIAYGQKGSGKSATLFGHRGEAGLVEAVCSEVFSQSEAFQGEGDWACQVRISCVEVSGSVSRCLLSPTAAKGAPIHIRSHQTAGVLMDGAARAVVANAADVRKVLGDARKARAVATTARHGSAARASLIVNFEVVQSCTGAPQVSSTITFVDVGAESVVTSPTAATPDPNLAAFQALVAAASAGTAGPDDFNRSPLTCILRTAFTTAHTTLVGCVAPGSASLADTTATVQLATAAMAIKTQHGLNEDVHARNTTALEAEIAKTEAELSTDGVRESSPSPQDPKAAVANVASLPASERLPVLRSYCAFHKATWAEIEAQSTKDAAARATVFDEIGLAGRNTDPGCPVLANLSEDAALSGALEYALEHGTTIVGSTAPSGDSGVRGVVLAGAKMRPQHVTIVVTGREGSFAPGSPSSNSEGSPKRAGATTTLMTPVGDAEVRVNGRLVTDAVALDHNARVILGEHHVFRYVDPAAAPVASPGSPGVVPVVDYHKAIEERFEQERAAAMAEAGFHEGKTSVENSPMPLQRNRSEAAAEDDEKRQMTMKISELQQKLSDMQDTQKSSLHNMYRSTNSLSRHADPAEESPTLMDNGAAASKQSNLASAASIQGAKVHRLPPQQVFRHKIVLLGHQEVGKTSLRKCFQSDPLFFKKLPDVQSTTGIEAQQKSITLPSKESIDLTVQDFAGQEAYHSHSLFLTNRTVFVLVWKVSAVEQDTFSKGINEAEEHRLCQWVTEVYAKYPFAPLAMVATHLDELRNSSQKVVEAILTKVGSLIQDHIRRIARSDGFHSDRRALPLVGNFAVSCKNRVIMGAGAHANVSGQKVSSLLSILGTAAMQSCKGDPVFWGGAVPGRHLQLIKEVEALAASGDKLLLPLADYVHLAARVGIESDKELLEVTQLMHTWNVLYMFNQADIKENAFLFLQPLWLCHIAGVLFSFAHVLTTPLHLRSIIGGLDYTVSAAEAADCGMMMSGYLRLPLARVLFAKALREQQKGREPDDQDVELCLKVLNALELIAPVTVQCTDPELLQAETPAPNSIRGKKTVVRYFVPSLSPFKAPEELKRVAPLLCNRGVHVAFKFNMLPNEMWYRLLHRLHKHRIPVVVASPAKQTEEYELALREATEVHNFWIDALWLGNESSRVLMVRESDCFVKLYSCEALTADEEEASGAILKDIEDETAALLSEYQGVTRTLVVSCPAQECHAGYVDVETLPETGYMTCPSCGTEFDVRSVVISGTSDLGPKLFSDVLHKEMVDMLHKSIDPGMVEKVCDFFGIRGDRAQMQAASLAVDNAQELQSLAIDFMVSLDRVVRYVILQQELEDAKEREKSKPEFSFFY